MTTITKTNQNKRIAAMRHIIKRNFNGNRQFLCYAFRGTNGVQMFCDGYLAVRLYDFAEIEYEEKSALSQFSEHIENEYFTKAIDGKTNGIVVSTDICKNIISAAKVAGLAKAMIWVGDIAFDAKLVKDACDMIGGHCMMCAGDTIATPAYLSGIYGDAIIMPLNISK